MLKEAAGVLVVWAGESPMQPMRRAQQQKTKKTVLAPSLSRREAAAPPVATAAGRPTTHAVRRRGMDRVVLARMILL